MSGEQKRPLTITALTSIVVRFDRMARVHQHGCFQVWTSDPGAVCDGMRSFGVEVHFDATKAPHGPLGLMMVVVPPQSLILGGTS